MKLQDILFSQGFGTRYDCAHIVEAGAVSIDGEEKTNPLEDFELEGLVLTVHGRRVAVSRAGDYCHE